MERSRTERPAPSHAAETGSARGEIQLIHRRNDASASVTGAQRPSAHNARADDRGRGEVVQEAT